MRVLRYNEYERPHKAHKVREERADVILGVGAAGLLGGHRLHRFLQAVHHECCACALAEVESRGDPVVPKGVGEGVGKLCHALGEGFEEHDGDHDRTEGVNAAGACVGLELGKWVLFE